MRRSAAAATLVALALLASCSTYHLGDQVAAGPGGGAAAGPGVTTGTGPGPTTGAAGPAVTLPPAGAVDDVGAAAGGGEPGAAPAGNVDPGTEARTASDRGVTADTVTLGIMSPAEDSLADIGATYEGRTVEQIAQPFIDEINDNGGINGRTVVPAYTRFNPASADAMIAACVQQSEDLRVFASFAIALYGEGEVCMANHETPLLSNSNSSEYTLYDRDAGWVRQTSMNKDRSLLNWMDWIVASGTATPATRIGVVYTDVPEDRQVMEQTVLPRLAELGLNVTEVAVFTLSSIDAMVSEAQRAAFRFKASEVELVLPVTNFLQFFLFVQQADLTGYVPRYTVTDFGGMASDSTAFYPASQWEGVTGITSTLAGQPLRNGVPDAPGPQDCLRVYNEAGLYFNADPNAPGLPDGIEVGAMLALCQHIALFADAARRAGVNPTRQSFLDAVGTTGLWTHRVTQSPPLNFRPDRYDSVDAYAVVRWQGGCNGPYGCYRRVEGFRQGQW